MNFPSLLSLVALSGVVLTSQAQTTPLVDGSATNLNREEERFLQDAVSGGQAETELAKLALQRSSDAAVKRFAQQLVTDHTRMNRQLDTLARKKGVQANPERVLSTSDGRDTSKRPTVARVQENPPAVGGRPEPQTSSGSDAKAIREVRGSRVDEAAGTDFHGLSNLTGTEFDQAFVRKMIADHEMAVSNFEAGQRSVSDSDIKAFIAGTLPMLRAHLNTARSLSKR